MRSCHSGHSLWQVHHLDPERPRLSQTACSNPPGMQLLCCDQMKPVEKVRPVNNYNTAMAENPCVTLRQGLHSPICVLMLACTEPECKILGERDAAGRLVTRSQSGSLDQSSAQRGDQAATWISEPELYLAKQSCPNDSLQTDASATNNCRWLWKSGSR